MEPKVIQNTLAFLQRVQLQGNEVPAYIECVQALQAGIQERRNDRPPTETVGGAHSQ